MYVAARRRFGLSAHADESGFAAVDALVALTILSTTLILSLGAVETARRASTSAAETRRASELLQYLVDTAPARVGSANGRSAGFDWSVNVRPSVAAHGPALQLCERSAQVTSLQTGRRYALGSARICPTAATS